MAQLNSKVLLENIRAIGKAINSLSQMNKEITECASVTLALCTLRAKRHELVQKRKEMELCVMRELGENDVTFTWWYFPKAAKKHEEIPFILYESTRKYCYWIDAVSEAVDCALNENLLSFKTTGVYVLILKGKTEKYCVYSGRTCLYNNGTLPELFKPKCIPLSDDQEYLIRTMQIMMDSWDDWDGPKGYPFILLKPEN